MNTAEAASRVAVLVHRIACQIAYVGADPNRVVAGQILCGRQSNREYLAATAVDGISRKRQAVARRPGDHHVRRRERGRIDLLVEGETK